MKRFAFPKRERLASKKRIDTLFEKGVGVFSHPIMAKYIRESSEDKNNGAQVLMVVPKKKIKKAWKRNLIRRKMREAYRLNKTDLLTWVGSQNLDIKLALVYVSSDILPFQAIQKSVVSILQQISRPQKLRRT